MSNCDSCSGCPASAQPGLCESQGPEIHSIGDIKYTVEEEFNNCRGCVGMLSDDICQALSSKHECATNNLVFVRVPSRLSKPDLDDLKKKAIEKYAGVWLHHWGQMIEEEVLVRNGLVKRSA